jgi:hypothetical protein
MSDRARRLAVPRALVALVTAGVIVVLALVARPPVILRSFVEHAGMFAMGMWIVRAAAGRAAGWLPVVAFGPILGFGLGSLSLLALWVLGARGLWTVVAAPALVLPLIPLARRVEGRWRWPMTMPGDRAAIAAAVLVVPLVIAAPFAHVGASIEQGKAYRAYFTADYVWRRAVVAELAKGDVLPVNPFYVDDALHYYWLPHLTDAVAYRQSGVDLDELLLAHSTLIDACFVMFLFGLARVFVGRPWAAAVGVSSVVLCSSYEGLYAIWDHWHQGAPLTLLRYLNIDAISRWTFSGMPIDGLQRVLFYQPHHAAGYALGFLGVLAVTRRVRRFDPMAMATGGTLLGLSVLVSSFAGLMLTVAAAVWEAGSVIRWRDWWRAAAHWSAAALPLALAAALVTALQYVDTGGSIITVGRNETAFHRWWQVTALSFGPVLVVAALAALAMLRARDRRAWIFAALWITCAVFYFFVDIRDHQNVYVGWRVGHLWFITSTTLAAAAYCGLLDLPRFSRRLLTGVAVVAALAGLPTTAIDIYNTQDVHNHEMGPGFRWTMVLSNDAQEAFQWIRTHTSPYAVFQVDAWHRGTEGWATIPAFAERRLAVGLPISMVPIHKYEAGSIAVRSIFGDTDMAAAHHLAVRFGVDYVFIGSQERDANPGVLDRLDSAPALFHPVFRNDGAAIYLVDRGTPGETAAPRGH